MKKLFLAATLFMAFAAVSSAQWWGAGSFSYDSFNTESTDEKGSSFLLMPRVGYELNDKWTVGGGIGYMSETSEATQGNVTIETKTNMFIVAPFARYKFASLNKFKFSGEGMIGFGFGGSKMTSDGTVVSEPDLSSVGLTIAPIVGYEINDKWEIETTINLFGLNYTSTKMSEDGTSTTDNEFHLGAGTDELFTVGAITVSAIYKF